MNESSSTTTTMSNTTIPNMSPEENHKAEYMISPPHTPPTDSGDTMLRDIDTEHLSNYLNDYYEFYVHSPALSNSLKVKDSPQDFGEEPMMTATTTPTSPTAMLNAANGINIQKRKRHNSGHVRTRETIDFDKHDLFQSSLQKPHSYANKTDSMYNDSIHSPSFLGAQANLKLDIDVGQKMKQGMKSIFKKTNDMIAGTSAKLENRLTAVKDQMRLKRPTNLKIGEEYLNNKSPVLQKQDSTSQLEMPENTPKTNISPNDLDLIEKMSLESGTTTYRKEKNVKGKQVTSENVDVPAIHEDNINNSNERHNYTLDERREFLAKHMSMIQEISQNQSNLNEKTSNIYLQQALLKNYTEKKIEKIENFRKRYTEDKGRNERSIAVLEKKVMTLEAKIAALTAENQNLRNYVNIHDEDIAAFRKSIDNLERYVQKSSQRSGWFMEMLFMILAFILGFISTLIVFTSSIFKSMKLIKPSKRSTSNSLAVDALTEIQKKFEAKRRVFEELSHISEFVPIDKNNTRHMRVSSDLSFINSDTLSADIASYSDLMTPTTKLEEQKEMQHVNQNHESTLEQLSNEDEQYNEEYDSEVSFPDDITNDANSSNEDEFYDIADNETDYSYSDTDSMPEETHVTEKDSFKMVDTNQLLMHQLRINTFSSHEIERTESTSTPTLTRSATDDEEIMKEAQQCQSLSKLFLTGAQSPRARSLANEATPNNQNMEDTGNNNVTSNTLATEVEGSNFATRSSELLYHQNEDGDESSLISNEEKEEEEEAESPSSKLNIWLKKVSNGEDLIPSKVSFDSFDEQFAEFS